MKHVPPIPGLLTRSAHWAWWVQSAFGLFFFCTTAMAADVVVIANASVPLDHVDRTELRAIYTLRKRLWSDGTPVTVFTLPDDNAVQQIFAKQVLHLYPYQLRLDWGRAVFSGTGRAPNEVGDAAAMLAGVKATPGAIGYVSPAEPLPEGVKMLQGDTQ